MNIFYLRYCIWRIFSVNIFNFFSFVIYLWKLKNTLLQFLWLCLDTSRWSGNNHFLWPKPFDSTFSLNILLLHTVLNPGGFLPVMVEVISKNIHERYRFQCSSKNATLLIFNNKQQKIEIQFVTNVGFSNLAQVKPSSQTNQKRISDKE